MSRTRLSSKGQVVIPKDIRDSARWEPGAELDVVNEGNVVTIRPVEREPRFPTREEIDRVAGMLQYNGPPKTIAQMNEGVAEMFRRDWKR